MLQCSHRDQIHDEEYHSNTGTDYSHYTDHSLQDLLSEHSAVSIPLTPTGTIPVMVPMAECHRDLGIFHEELPEDLYFKMLSFLDCETVCFRVRLVSRSWCFMASQAASIGHLRLGLPATNWSATEWKRFQFVRALDIEWKGDSKYDRWSDWNRTLSECFKCSMRHVERLRILNFHDFSFYSFTDHPLRALLAQQAALREIELMATVNWKEHDIADCVSLFLRTDIHETLQSLILHNFVITPSKEELSALRDGDGSMMLRSAKVFGEFLVKCGCLRTFRWYTDHIHRQYTCHGIQSAFCGIYLPSLAGNGGGIEDLHLPSFPLSYQEEERALYRDLVHKLKLKRLHFRGDLSIMDWRAMGRHSESMEHLHLNPSRTTNESFTACFTECGASLKYLVIDTMTMASSGWYQNDELTNFILPYFRGRYLKNIQQIDVTVKFLEEGSLFSFLLKCKCARSLQKLTINAQFGCIYILILSEVEWTFLF